MSLLRLIVFIPTRELFKLGLAALLGTLGATMHVQAAPVPPVGVSYATQIRPLLSDRCYKCHGPDEATREAGLRLDDRDAAQSLLESGVRALVPGDPAASELFARLTAVDPDGRMPPVETGKTLDETQIDSIRRWIAEGAKFERHWAFVAPQRLEPPRVEREGWKDHPLDRFVAARLASEGLAPAPPAAPEKLVRRLHFDLLGLPPTPDAIDRFVKAWSASPRQAVSELVDRLFASPHYGERLAAEWLDVARYADSNGYQNDFARSMWPWRDWVINAFNANMPYDQFVTEQLAGDLLPDATLSQRIATGFNRNHRTVTEAGSIEQEWHVENVIDRVETTGAAFLGLTVGCGRCHDHKFDPLTQRELYSLYAFFNSINEKGVYTETRGNVPPMARIPTEAEADQVAALERQIVAAQRREPQALAAAETAFDDWRRAPTHVDAPVALLRIPLADNSTAQRTPPLEPIVTEAASSSTWVCDWFGSSARFSGQQSLAYPQAVKWDRDLPLTIAAWVRREGEGAILSKMDDASAFRGIDLLLVGDGQVAAHLIHQWPNDGLKVSVETSIPKFAWTHVALVYDGSGMAAGVKIYLNGAEQPLKIEQDKLQGSFATDQPLRIGKRSSDLYLKGDVADVQAFDCVLDSQQIAAVAGQRLVAVAKAHLPNVERAAAEDAAADDATTAAAGDRPAVLPSDESLSDEQMEQFKGLYLALGTGGAVQELAQLRRDLAKYEGEKARLEATFPSAMVMEELPQPRPTFVLLRGRYDAPDPQQPVQPDVPSFLPPFPADAPRNRLGLARWLTDPHHPLTARVAVNRMWQRFFGIGLVKTAEDFGVQADPPVYPELLDWLATELIHSDWDLQRLQRIIVTSAVYQQDSSAQPSAFATDPDNRMLARGPRFRLPAEEVRDNALAVSGLLSPHIGGPSVMPYQPAGLWEELAGGAHEDYVQDHGEKLYRRSLYVYRKRTVPHPSMSTFDAPSWEICQVKRSRTNTPLQALALLNDVAYVEAARKLAERMLTEGGADDLSRIAWAFRQSTARQPHEEELRWLGESLARYRAVYAADADAAHELLQHGESPVATQFPADELAAHATLASLLLNLDETVTKD